MNKPGTSEDLPNRTPCGELDKRLGPFPDDLRLDLIRVWHSRPCSLFLLNGHLSQSLLCLAPRGRPTARKALEAPYFAPFLETLYTDPCLREFPPDAVSD